MVDLLTRSRAAALDEALTAEMSGSAPPEAVAADLALVHRLEDAGEALAAEPAPEFREALRTRLMAVAAVQGVGATAGGPAPAALSWRARATTVTAAILATVVTAGGVAVASSRALPGDPFYGVKRTTEALQLKLAGDHGAEGTRHLQFAATRLREVRALVLGRDAPAGTVPAGALPADVEDDVHGALVDMDVDTRTGLALLTSSFRATRAPEPLEELSRFAAAQGAGLRDILPALSGPARLQAWKSLTLVEGVRAESDGLLMLVDCTAACDPGQVAPVEPVPGSPCRCPSPVPPPQTAPPPPAADAPAPPAGPQPDRAPEPGASTPPSTTPPPASQQPQPGPGLPVPGTPGLPGLPEAPPLPLPSPPALPPVAPLGPSGPAVELPSLDDVLPAVSPALLGGGAGLRALLGWVAQR